MRSLRSGGWALLCLFLLQGLGGNLYSHPSSLGRQHIYFRLVAEQRKKQTISPMTTEPGSSNTPLHFQESFTSHQYLAYTDGVDWNTSSQQISLQLQDNVGQQDVVIADARDAASRTHYLYSAWQDLRNDSGDIYLQKLDQDGNRLWPTDQRVNNDDGNAIQFSPSIVVDSAGNLLVAWVDNRNGNNDIYLQRLDGQGQAVWTEDLRIHDDTGAAEQGAPMLAIDNAGIISVAWHDNRAGDYDVYLQQLDLNGTRQWATDLRVNQDNSLAAQTYPVVNVEAAGVIVVAWLDRRIGNGDIYLQRISLQGHYLWAQEVRVNQATEQTGNRPALALLASGGIVVSWLDPLEQHIYLQSLDQQGNRRWSNTVRANQIDLPANENRSPALVKLGSGLLVGWERAQDQALYAQMINDQGDLQWPAERRIIASAAGVVVANARFVALTARGEQQVLAAWSDQRDHPNGDIYAQGIDALGTQTWPADVRVDDAAGTVDQTLADVATTADGHSTLVWQDRRFGAVPQLYLQRVTADGQLRWSNYMPVYPTNATRYAQRAPKVASLGDDTLIAWSDTISDVARIYLQRIDVAGNRVWTLPRPLGAGSDAQTNPALVVNPQADVFVAWETTPVATSQIALLRLNANGESQWSMPTTLARPDGASRLPDLASDGEGNVYVTWLVTTDVGTDLYLQKVTRDGGLAWAAPVVVNSAQGLVNRFNPPGLVTNAAGTSIVVWVDNRQSGIYAQSIDHAGQKVWTNDVLLNPNAVAFSPAPAIAAGPEGSAIIVWQGFEQGVSAIHAQRVTSAGDVLWNGFNSLAVKVSEGGGPVAAPRVASDGQGASYITWGDERRNNPDIFMQRLDSAGQRTWPADQAIVQPDQFYRAEGGVESRTVDRAELPIRQATLTADFDRHGGAIEFMLTNNGVNWQHVQLGERIVFTTTGSDLRWRAQLRANPHNFATTPILHALQIDYYTAMPLANNTDRYEVDDSCEVAQALQTNGAVQPHTLVPAANVPADEDWVRIHTGAGQSYLLGVTPEHRDAVLQLALYADCGTPALTTVRSNAGQSALLQWTTNVTGVNFVRVTAMNSTTTASTLHSSLAYQISVREQISAGLAILVAGRLADAPTNQAAIDQTVDRTYQRLQQHGYAPAQIQYLGRHTGVTLQALQTAIQGWAVAQQVSAPASSSKPLLIYLVGRGTADHFYLNETESITPALLNLWLDNLTAQAAIQPIVLVLEARNAGSFISTGQTVSDTATLSAPNRVLITATNAKGQAWRTNQGLLFSDLFWTNLVVGQSLQQSFLAARQAVVEAGYFCQTPNGWCQEPWLDDDGDAAPNPTLAAELAGSLGLPVPSTQAPPQIQTVSTAWNEATRTLSIEAHLLVSAAETQVEAHLLPLPYQPVITDNDVFPPLQHPILVLQRADEVPIESVAQPQTYRGAYQLPDQAAGFWISVYAWDSAGLMALPLGVQFQNKFFLYLPIVNK